MNACDFKESEQYSSMGLDLPEGIPPLRAFYLYLSNSCNLACKHCWITPRYINGKPDPGDVIDVENLKVAIMEAKPLGLSSIKLTGGEPMLHPRFREINEFITQEDLNLAMETNGTLITEETARFLKNDTSMGFISVSIDGDNSATHDAFRGVEGAFDSVLLGLDHLVAAGYDNVQVIMSIYRGNLNQIENVVRLAANHGAASIKFTPVTSFGRGSNMEQRGELLDFQQRMALQKFVFQDLKPKLQDEGVTIKLVLNAPPALTPINEMLNRQGNTGDCGVRGILGILGSGEIALCGIGRNIPELTYGHLGIDSIRDIWLHHPTLLKLRRDLDDVDNYPGICGECKLARNCRTGCVALNYVDSRKLIWPYALCENAKQLGLFPATRKKQ